MDPREVGSLLFSHPEVAEVCVLTVPNCHAFVVLAHNASATLESLRDFCLEQMAQRELPPITLLDEMPKSCTGAVDRGQLVEMAQASALQKNVA